MKLHVNNETSLIEAVLLGIGIDRGKPHGINPMMRMHLENNNFPGTEDICGEISELETVLKNHSIEVLRPDNIPGIEQIFIRDIGFVVEDYFFISNMKHPIRSVEIKGISRLLEQFNSQKVIKIPKEITIEGGDVMLWKENIFVGIGDRTSPKGADFLRKIFPDKNVLTFDLVVDQNDVDKNVLHLDCTFQPIGHDEAIIYLGGFKQKPEELLRLFSGDKLIQINQEQKNRMFSNIFSISPRKIVIEKGFKELGTELRRRNYEVFEVNFAETSKLNGLLRCSILPLRRTIA